ncbi:1824_t:CDS:2 [Ambispora gerdemannii]|uniref:1824_t:CDS:1 n=1 Tax=Ambispora gerdemannii TaxID=144530 RepID=A0A9N8ZZ42_9GLOM|nr:1824_t:CDS:2 [Ambispora gerdemannii]
MTSIFTYRKLDKSLVQKEKNVEIGIEEEGENLKSDNEIDLENKYYEHEKKGNYINTWK